MILARLQVADGEHERSANAELPPYRAKGHVPIDHAKPRRNGVGDDHDLIVVQLVVLEDRPAGEFAGG
jgi:hypothetical protein